MAFIGRLHPLRIHFLIALVIAAAAAESATMVTADDRWRTMAVGNVRAGAAFALLPGTSEDCWLGARTFCAHEGGTRVTHR
ncbi:MAG: hypothetical protein C5B57_03315 [Blastocatellia bacterium]|nr:MAG: hypothetical protein C5B57_03315 [Blastocatellia bacterium]